MEFDAFAGSRALPGLVAQSIMLALKGRRHRRPARPGPSRLPNLGDLSPVKSWTKPVKVESLRVYEGNGHGHTLSRHVNNAPGADVARLEREPDIPASGSFFNEAVAQEAVDAAFAANRDQVRNWLSHPKSKGPFVRDYDMGKPVGSVLTRVEYKRAKAAGEAPVNVPASTVRIVLRRSNDFPEGFFVLTAYPVPTIDAAAMPPLRIESLQRYEGDGHTLQRHVEIEPAELARRLEREPDISAASRFSDTATAQRAVERALTARTSEIHNWLASGQRAPLTGDVDLGEPVGVVLDRRAFDRGRRQPAPATRIHFIVARSDRYPGGFYVKTAYPVLPW